MKPTDKTVQVFTADLRRVIYLAKLLKYNSESLKKNHVTPYFMKGACTGIENAINRFFADAMCKTTPEIWQAVKMDMGRDELHDISLLLDTVSDVKNVAEIVEIITGCKTTAA